MFLQAAAQAVNAVANGAVPVSDPGSALTFESYTHQLGVAAVAVYAIQVLKRAQWFPLLNANSEMMTRFTSTVVALISALAIQISVTGDASVGWHGSFSIPNVHALWDAVVRFIISKGMQTGIYDKFFNKPIAVMPVPPERMDEAGKPLVPPAVPGH